jgi:hypothetical protein
MKFSLMLLLHTVGVARAGRGTIGMVVSDRNANEVTVFSTESLMANAHLHHHICEYLLPLTHMIASNAMASNSTASPSMASNSTASHMQRCPSQHSHTVASESQVLDQVAIPNAFRTLDCVVSARKKLGYVGTVAHKFASHLSLKV